MPRLSDFRFFVFVTAVHAAVALPALWLWSVVCDRGRRRASATASSASSRDAMERE